MLRKLKLEKFKTHQATELEFSEGINVITGDSGHGKTNILLALNWIVNNRPLGNSIIKRGQDDCSVVLTFGREGEEYTIERSRTKSKNSYILNKEGHKLEEFTSFGNSPPEEVSKVLGLSDINIQKQFRPYFLILDPPGQVATYVRSLVKLDEIDHVVKLLSSKVRTKESELAGLQEDLKVVESELKELSKIDLESLEQRILDTKKVVEIVQKIEKKKSSLENIICELKVLEVQQIILPDDIDQKMDEVDRYCSLATELSEKINRLNSLVTKLRSLEECEIVLPGDLGDILSTEETTEEKYNNIYSKIETLLDTTEKLRNIQVRIDSIDKQLDNLCREETILMEKLDTCPSCGSKLTEESRKCLLGCTNE